ncbi:nucleotidyltransferase family protein [Streptococcus sp. H49]|uniref:nucleotidyltransferase family protein n=1 Tax=Streptococcus huangxiaojuni TaxID=3237239 RepID=UPI0034A1B142
MSSIDHIIRNSKEMMTLLEIISSFDLKDCWLCAGTLRNYIWDVLSGKSATVHFSDIDVIFFDDSISYNQTLTIEQAIKKQYPQYNWEVKNQYYMNSHSPNTDKYSSSKDAVSKFPEKCASIAARLAPDGTLEVFTPHGVDDLINFTVSPTPHYSLGKERRNVYNKRIMKKNWQKIWPNLSVEVFADNPDI